MDLFPTFAAIAKASLPPGLKLDGVNILPVLLEGRELPERTLFWRYEHKHLKAVRKGPWKLLIIEDEVGLYNLDDDLGENDNLAPFKPKLVAELKAELAAWEKDVDSVNRDEPK